LPPTTGGTFGVRVRLKAAAAIAARSEYDAAMDDPPWQFDDIRTRLLDTVEALNIQIRDAAHASPSTSARDRGEAGIAQWQDEVGRTIAILETAKKVILARLGPG
jgi:hypothetical protein